MKTELFILGKITLYRVSIWYNKICGWRAVLIRAALHSPWEWLGPYWSWIDSHSLLHCLWPPPHNYYGHKSDNRPSQETKNVWGLMWSSIAAAKYFHSRPRRPTQERRMSIIILWFCTCSLCPTTHDVTWPCSSQHSNGRLKYSQRVLNRHHVEKMVISKYIWIFYTLPRPVWSTVLNSLLINLLEKLGIRFICILIWIVGSVGCEKLFYNHEHA